MERLNRNRAHLGRGNDQDNGYVEGTPGYRFALVWEITKDVYSFAGSKDVERRLVQVKHLEGAEEIHEAGACR